MQARYANLIKAHEKTLQSDSFTFHVLGYAKFAFVVLICVLLYFIVTKDAPTMLIMLCFAGVAILIALWVYHIKIEDTINYLKGMIVLYNRQIDRITGKWTTFEDSGQEYMDRQHTYACDLDIVGQKSLFQLLNTTHTWYGRNAFVNDLLHPCYNQQEEAARQESVTELSYDIEFMSEMVYCFSQIGVTQCDQKLVEELSNRTVFIQSRALKNALCFLPALTLLFVIGIVLFKQEHLYWIGAVVAGFQAVIWLLSMQKTHQYLGVMSDLPYKLGKYSAVIRDITNRQFTAPKLKNIVEQLQSASEAMRDLGKIADKINIKHHGILYFLANVFLLWDIECAILFENWKTKYAHLAKAWFITIGEFESLLSLSHLPTVCDNTSLPLVLEKEMVLEAQSLGHPLLSNRDRVNNDFSFQHGIFIISGSNMSGKTTFMRTVGINLVLARTGGFVCAKQMKCCLVDVITSMRIADDLSEGISTFYAELRRIKQVIELIEINRQSVFLIDEIFRGTNSIDRLSGAKAVILRLNKLGASGMITSHDLALCELAGNGRIHNYNFSEQYKNNKICFDFKIKNGTAKTTNAQYLMRQIGILED